MKVQRGKAAYYGKGLAENCTASGELFAPERFTAAHRQLLFGTIVRVMWVDDERHTYVRINDHGGRPLTARNQPLVGAIHGLNDSPI